MRELGVVLNAAAAEAPDDNDAEYLQSTAWPEVVAVAGRLAQVMVANDLRELAALHNPWPRTSATTHGLSEEQRRVSNWAATPTCSSRQARTPADHRTR